MTAQAHHQHGLAPNAEHMQAHLEHLFGGDLDGHHEGFIEIAWTTVDAAGAHHLNKAQLFATVQMEEAVAKAVEVNTNGSNVYVGAALRKPGTPLLRRAGDRDVLCVTCAFIDCDDPGVAERAKLRWGVNVPT